MTTRKGDFYVISDRDGSKRWASETVIEYTGLRVGWDEVDYRHPQEFVRGRRDRQNVKNPRPEPPDVFVTEGDFNADFSFDFNV